MLEHYVYIIGLAASFMVAFSLGANDFANPTDCAVGAGVIDFNKALLLFSAFVFIGSLIQGRFIIKTLGGGVVPEIELIGAVSAVLATFTWVTIATFLGMPISTTHSATAGVLGVGLAYAAVGKIAINDINWGNLLNIVLSWITSPLASIALAACTYIALRNLLAKLRDDSRSWAILKASLIASLAFSAYSFGANDVANATGAYLFVTKKYLGVPAGEAMLFLSAIGSLGIITGATVLGRRVLETTAYKITKIDVVSGLAAELSNALVVWLFTTVPYMLFGYGIPISTTYSTVASIIGVGIAKKRSFSEVNWRTVLKIVTSWVTTLPAVVLLSITIYLILTRVI